MCFGLPYGDIAFVRGVGNLTGSFRSSGHSGSFRSSGHSGSFRSSYLRNLPVKFPTPRTDLCNNRRTSPFLSSPLLSSPLLFDTMDLTPDQYNREGGIRVLSNRIFDANPGLKELLTVGLLLARKNSVPGTFRVVYSAQLQAVIGKISGAWVNSRPSRVNTGSIRLSLVNTALNAPALWE